MKNQASRKYHAQKGSIFAMILIGIALFGALSFAMLQGSRSGAGQLTDQQAKLAATEIMDYLNNVKTTVNTLIINGCDILDLNFGISYQRNNGNPVEDPHPAPKENCSVFGPNTGLRPVTFEQYKAVEYTGSALNTKAGHFGARFVPVDSLGTTASELAFYSPGYNFDICLAVINMQKGSKEYTSVPQDLHIATSPTSFDPGPVQTASNYVLIAPSLPIYGVIVIAGDKGCNIGIVLRTR